MSSLIAQLRAFVDEDDALCLLPGVAGLYASACRFEPPDPARGLDAGVPEQAREYLGRMVPRRRGEFLAGRYCAARAISRASPGASQWVARAEDGRPLWPEGLAGSISHCRNTALAMVADSGSLPGIGVDVQERIAEARAAQLAERILAGYPRCDSLEGLALVVALTFSIKESLYKALFPLGAIGGGFDAADIVEWDHAGRRCRIQLRQPAAGWPGPAPCFHADYAYNDWLVQSRVVVRKPGFSG